MSSASVAANITAGEILPPDRSIELAFRAPVDPQSAQGAIQLSGPFGRRTARMNFVKRGKAVQVHLDGTGFGAFELVVSELLGKNGELLVDSYTLPFAIVDLSARMPDDVRIEHAVRLVIGDLHVARRRIGTAFRGAALTFSERVQGLLKNDTEPRKG